MELPTADAEAVERREEEIEERGRISVVECDEYETIEDWECHDCYSGSRDNVGK